VHRPLQHTPGVLAENRRRYELLVEMVEHYAAQADVERVLKAATLAANYAWLAPIGLLSDVRLERTVVHAVLGSGRVTVDGDRPRLSVSLPFLPDDELRGDRTEACLIALLARTGRTADDCGDVSVGQPAAAADRPGVHGRAAVHRRGPRLARGAGELTAVVSIDRHRPRPVHAGTDGFCVRVTTPRTATC
jgi:hypothetical protein